MSPVTRECLPFSSVPHITALFRDYLYDFPRVSRFFPRPPNSRDWLRDEAAALRYDDQRRHAVASILERQNRQWNASQATLDNINRLRAGAFAIVSGQQAGLFGGPLLGLLKALSAARMAADATSAGIDCVPVFWMATEDHDLAEINHVSMPNAEGALQTFISSSRGIPDAPVGEVQLDDTTSAVVEEASALLAGAEQSGSEIADLLRRCYRPGETFGSAFARLYSGLLGEFGVILLDAADPALDAVAAPVYRAVLTGGTGITEALLDRGAQLRAAGYHEQVKVTRNSTLLFCRQNGARVPLHRSGEGFTAGGESFEAKQLVERAASNPELFSPNALLRPVVQDFLLPTLAYFGGPAEIAYFAQAAVVYEEALGRVTPILPRLSATLLDARARRLLGQYGLNLTDVFAGAEQLRQELAGRALSSDLQSRFDALQNQVNAGLAGIKDSLTRLDPTLADAADRAGSKIAYQLESLQGRAATILARRNAEVTRHAGWLSSTLFPNKALQERELAGIWFLARNGTSLLRTLYDCAGDVCPDHQVLQV